MVFGYVRVSTKKQEKGQSLEDQRDAIFKRYPSAMIVAETKGG